MFSKLDFTISTVVLHCEFIRFSFLHHWF